MIKSEESKSTHLARVFIVDDHPAVREGLALRISQQANMEVCGEATDVVEAIHLIAELNPDVAVIDISLKSGNGIDLIKRIKDRNETIKMLAWSMFDARHYAERAMRAGAMGYIGKDQGTVTIIDAINSILEGKIYLSEEASNRMLTSALGRTVETVGDPRLSSLSDREMEVFRLMGEGLDSRQVSERLHISMKTVETYRGRIKEKLNLASSSELLWQAMRWNQENS